MANLSRLPPPTQDQYEWQYQGACKDAEPEMFFSPAFERGNNRAHREAVAKWFCSICPVTRDCLLHALRTEEPFGVWGGKTTKERQSILRSRRRDSATDDDDAVAHHRTELPVPAGATSR